MNMNYIRMAFRVMKKYKMHSAINIIGLSIGMALCLVMLMYAANEFSYDNYHANGERIYRIYCTWGNEGSTMNFAGVMPGLAPELSSDNPNIEVAARVKWNNEMTLQAGDNKEFKEEGIFSADPGIIRIFPLHLVDGDEANALTAPYSIVLTQSMAAKYFGTENPVGKIMVIDGETYEVTGLLLDQPQNTHLQFKALIFYSTVVSKGEYPADPWGSWGNDMTYLLLKKGAPADECSKAVVDIFKKNTNPYLAQKILLGLQPLYDIHWNNTLRADIGPKGSKLYAYLFLSAAILVLIIASFNFMNLSTTKFLDRAKEVGVRKVIGANRLELIKQFLVESVMLALIASAIGVAVYELLSGVIYSYMNVDFVMHSERLIIFYAIIISMLLIVGVVAGLYPATLISKFEPVQVINGKSITRGGQFSFRNISLIMQFAISVILICTATVIFQQINYMKNSDLGFKKENVIFAQLPMGQPEVKEKYEVLKNELLRNQNITQVSGAYTIPGVNSQFQMGVKRQESEDAEMITIQTIPVDYEFINVLGLELREGRNFSKEFSTDPTESIILNKTAVDLIGLQNPIGETLLVPFKGEFRYMKVIGVVDDFHIKSLHNKIAPALLMIYPQYYSLIAARFTPGSESTTIKYFKSTWQSMFPGTDFNYRFMADEYDNNYKTEDNASKLISIFTVLALFISCLGLFGMVSFITSKKVKEIGIRKTLGASIKNITVGLSKQFVYGVLVANIIAWPVAYYLMDKWLQDFAYKISIDVWMFVVSFAVVMFITLVTVGIQTIKAALANPFDSLRYE